MKLKNLTRSSLVAITVGLVSFGPAVMAIDTTVTVKPSNMDGWAFRTAHASGGTITSSYGFEIGPGSPPAGSGSAEFKTGSDGDSFAELRNVNFHGVKLSDLTSLTYSTFVTAKTVGQCVAGYILLSVDVDGDGVFDPLGGPDDGLFFEPCYQTGTYVTEPPGQLIPVQCPNPDPLCFSEGGWVSWNALNGGWWSAKYGGSGGPPLTLLPNYLAKLAGMNYPSPKIANSGPCLGGLRLRAGPGPGAWPNFEGNVDKLTVGVSGMNTTYDFEFENLPIRQCGASPETAITACKFYDFNANGILDAGDSPLDNWAISISPLGSAIPNQATQLTSGGCVSWGNLDTGLNPYTVTEGTPNQSNWIHSTSTSTNVSVVFNQSSTVNFGNYCRVSSGGNTLGFWSNKNGQALTTLADFAALTACKLVNADGTDRDFTGSLGQNRSDLRSWLLNASATNMAYMLSAQLAAMKLNVLHGFVDGNAFALCFNGTVNQLIAAANAALINDTSTLAGDPNRPVQQTLKNCLDSLNNGGFVVPTTPCPHTFELLAAQQFSLGSATGVSAVGTNNVKAMFP